MTLKSKIRISCGLSSLSRVPVTIILGSDKKPTLCGDYAYYTTRNGTRVVYPNAYRKKCYFLIYKNSTRRVEVGSDFILNMK